MSIELTKKIETVVETLVTPMLRRQRWEEGEPKTEPHGKTLSQEYVSH